MAEVNIPRYEQYVIHEESAGGLIWDEYIEGFEVLMAASGITDVKRQRALLLHYVGHDVRREIKSMENTGQDDDIDLLKAALKNRFSPKKTKAYEKHLFRQARQEPDETTDRFHARLQRLVKNCQYANPDDEVCTQIIENCTSQRLRRRALRDDMDLPALLKFARAMEISESQAANIEGNLHSTPVNAVRRDAPVVGGQRWQPMYRPQPQRYPQNQRRRDANPPQRRDANPPQRRDAYPPQRREYPQRDETSCYNCDGQHGPRNPCPARGQECYNCGRRGHYSRSCHSGRRQNPRPRGHENVNATFEEGDDDVTYAYGINTANKSMSPTVDVSIHGKKINFLIDTGASINVMDEQDFNEIRHYVKLKKSTTRIFPYKSTSPIETLGEFKTKLVCNTRTGKRSTSNVLIHVVKHNGRTGESLLSFKTAEKLGLVQILNRINGEITETESLLAEYSDLFQGLGKLKNYKVKLHIDESVQPVAQPHRRIPFHIRKKVEEQLAKLEAADIIEPVHEATPWISPILVVPKPRKPEEIRICVDMRRANEAVKRERHLMPTRDEIIQDLDGSTIFSKLDLNQGYHQLELEPESRYITTFSTHIGLRRYKRLNFGVSSASEIFQNTIRQAIDGIPGVKNISDDILVHGKTAADHRRSLRAILQRLRDCNLTLNKEKCEFNKPSIIFYGHKFSAAGMSPDPEKVSAIKRAAAPITAAEVRSLLGTVTYFSRFIPDLATVTQPLRALTVKDAPWEWTDKQQNALDTIKERLTSDTVMTYFDPEKITELIVDASPVGLGAMLTQRSSLTDNPRVLSYASKSLTPVEQRYSQTEREALAVVWACEHFHIYVYGKPVTVVTDHKPLERLYNSSCAKPPVRIERWALRLQNYDARVVYRPGKENPADYMSRHPNREAVDSNQQQRVAEEYVNFVARYDTPIAISLDQIKKETLLDPTLQAVTSAVKTGKWYETKENDVVNEDFDILHRDRDLLTLLSSEDLILRGPRIVIPMSLRERIVGLAHEGHQGIVKTKQLLREKVYFPRMDKFVEAKIERCIPCQAATPRNQREPLIMTPLPDYAWQHVSIDFCGPFPSGEYLLVMIDNYSRFPVVEIIRSTSGAAVIPRIDKIFSEYGIPESLTSDNGPPFQGYEFKQFAQYLGFQHRKITPLWPQANGESERFMRTIEKAIRIAQIERRHPWQQELYAFLRNYRATPHATTGTCPATTLFERPINIKLPVYRKPRRRSNNQMAKSDREAKNKMKQYADGHRNAKTSNTKIGDTVLIKNTVKGKMETPFKPVPYEIINKKGSMLTARRGEHKVTRNSSFFKVIPRLPVNHNERRYLDDDDEEFEINVDPATNSPPMPDVNSPAPAARHRYPRRDHRPPLRFGDWGTYYETERYFILNAKYLTLLYQKIILFSVPA